MRPRRKERFTQFFFSRDPVRPSLFCLAVDPPVGHNVEFARKRPSIVREVSGFRHLEFPHLF